MSKELSPRRKLPESCGKAPSPTKIANAKLRDQQNRRQEVEVVRGHLSKSVKPELLDAAVITFMSQHKFGLRDGKVIVVGTQTGTNTARGFSIQIARLRGQNP